MTGDCRGAGRRTGCKKTFQPSEHQHTWRLPSATALRFLWAGPPYFPLSSLWQGHRYFRLQEGNMRIPVRLASPQSYGDVLVIASSRCVVQLKKRGLTYLIIQHASYGLKYFQTIFCYPPWTRSDKLRFPQIDEASLCLRLFRRAPSVVHALSLTLVLDASRLN